MRSLLLFLYFAVILSIGALSFKKAKGSLSFFLAGRDAGIIEVTGSLLATVLGSSAILGSVSFAYSKGWAGVWFMLCGALGLILLYPLIPKLRGFKGYNLPDLLGKFYGKELKILSSIVIPIAWIGIVGAQVIGAAQIIGMFIDIPYNQAVILSGTIFIIYTILGGQLSIIKTDCFQLLILLIGIVITYFTTSTGALSYNVPKIISEKFTGLDLFILIITYSSTFLVGPDIYSRIFCAKNEEVAKKSILLSVACLIPLAFILASIGIQVAYTDPGLDIVSKSPLLHLASTGLSKPVSLLLYFGLLSAVISSADTTLITLSSIFAQIFTGDLENRKSVGITRIFIALFGIFSIIVALKLKFILASLFLALAVFSGAFIIPTLAGLAGYKGRKEFTITAVTLGGMVAFLGKVYGNSDINSVMNSNYILILAFIINGVVLFIPKFYSSVIPRSEV
ncbi:MAG: sodium:solute symporter family protein [Fusobacteriaceae bacterium]